MDSDYENYSPPAKKRKTLNPVASKLESQVNRVYGSGYYNKKRMEAHISDGWIPTLQVDIPELKYGDLSDGFGSE